MGECWYKETTKSVSNIPSVKSDNNELLWLYESGNMYLGSWKSVRCGSGGRFLSVEHGDGISYEATPTYRKGHCFSGKFEDGVASGYGRSFWLHNSPSWISNYLPESQIKEDDITGRRTGNFLPYEYVGQWRQNQKHDRYGVATLKDGTKKIGGWAYDIVVSDKWWIGFDHSPASIPKERVDWRTVHEDYVDGYLKVSSPASRSKKRKKYSKQQHESSSCYFSSVANFPAAATSSVAAVVSPTRASRDVHGHFLCTKNRTNNSKSDHRQRSTNSSNNHHDTSKEMQEKTQQNQEIDNASDDVNPGAVDSIVPSPAHISSSSTTQAHHQSSTTATGTGTGVVENTSATGVTTRAVTNNSNRNRNRNRNNIVPDPAHVSSSSTTQHHRSSTTRSGVENTNAIGVTSTTVTNNSNTNSHNRANNNNDGGSSNNVRDKDHGIVFVLKWEAIGYNADDDEMEKYAKEFNLLGLHSIKMIEK
jgi:hypothetical protein